MGKDHAILENINSPKDLKNLSISELETLSAEIREFLIESISRTGGHLGSNLGIVELTAALHYVFDSPNDKIIWDVSHQSYVHKILTGRRGEFSGLRKSNGISGFAKRNESPHDIFGAGHSSTSLSAAVGIARANIMDKKDDFTIAVVGDGSITGGMIYEAMDNISDCKNLIMILNDNGMSISKNVGAVSNYIAKIRTTENYYQLKHRTNRVIGHIPFAGKYILKFLRSVKKVLRRWLYNSVYFEHFGFDFLGPVNGHNIKKLISVLKEAKMREKPVFIHVKTEKGKGYENAEKSSLKYHSVGAFDIENGVDEDVKGINTFTGFFSKEIVKLAEKNPDICAITAAMTEYVGLSEFQSRFPKRFFDVGIAEEHAVTFACGLAIGGKIPVFAVYSTFMQRSYDQILHDAAIQKLHIVVVCDRAGLVGEDGATHHGIFDSAFLNSIPGIEVYSPSSFSELSSVLNYAVNDADFPVFIRYPKGGENTALNEKLHGMNGVERDFVYKRHKDKKGRILIVSYGRISSIALEVCEKLNETDTDCDFLKLIKITPLNNEIHSILDGYEYIFFIEEGIRHGGIGECVASLVNRCTVKIYAIDDFIEQGTVKEQFAECGFDSEKIYNDIIFSLLERKTAESSTD